MITVPNTIKIKNGLDKEDLLYFREGEILELVDRYELSHEKDKFLYVAKNADGLKICLYEEQMEVVPC